MTATGFPLFSDFGDYQPQLPNLAAGFGSERSTARPTSWPKETSVGVGDKGPIADLVARVGGAAAQPPFGACLGAQPD
jgi:hypothetical protein